ncbi:MAG TPA: class I SAM-dependent methyltransferase [Longimicrobium sp.]|nr:class I SAM-dependent methyltransferase [Longimicrobium sp.]
MSQPDPPNRDQSALWNDASGRAWVEMQDVLDRVLAPFGARLIDEAFPGEGARVADIGCGAGATTVAMARRVGPAGSCLGVDISGPLVAAARTRAAAEAVDNVAFVQADAQIHAFQPGSVDAIISRFGVMFFDDPAAAFANLRRAARQDAKLTFIAWRGPADNPFLTLATRTAAPHLPPLPAPAPDEPGQFAFADGDRVRRILAASGWSNVDVAPLDVPCSIAEADLSAYVTRLGPVGAALRDADEATRARITNLLRDTFAPHVRDGAAAFTGACWLVTARA